MGPAKRTAANKKFFCKAAEQKQRQNSKETRHCQRDKKGQRDKAKTRAKERSKRVASKDQQGEVPGPSFEEVCLSAGKAPNQD